MQVLEPGRDIGAAFSAGPGNAVTKAVAAATEITAVKDLADLVGQPVARRAAEICAAGGHHLMLLGPPGVGKPMLDLAHRPWWELVSCSAPGQGASAHDRGASQLPGGDPEH